MASGTKKILVIHPMSGFKLSILGKRFKGLGARVRSISRMTDDDVGWDGRKLLNVAKLCHEAMISCNHVSPKTNWKHRRGIQLFKSTKQFF